jgi:hypothetical protein
MHLVVYKRLNAADLGLTIKTAQGVPVVSFLRTDQNSGVALEPGHPTVEITIGDLPLAPGDYFVDVFIDPRIGGTSCDAVYNYPLLSVVNDGQINLWLDRPWGVIQCQDVRWNISVQNPTR